MFKTKHYQSEQGQVIIIIAFIMIAMIAMLGLAIDGGRLMFLQRDVQNATDSAIVAATYARCTGGSDAQVIHAARQAAKKQGFVHGVDGVVILVDPNYSGSTTNTKYIQVSINSPEETFFIQIVYNHPLAIQSDSVGRCNIGMPSTSSPNIRAVFAGANSCGAEENVNAAGSNWHITGGVHSNGDWYSGNSDIHITGNSTIVGSENGNGANYSPPLHQGANSLTDPLASEYYFSRFDVGGDIYNEALAAGRIVLTSGVINVGWLQNSCTIHGQPCYSASTKVLQDGIYVTTKNGGTGITGGMSNVHGDGGLSDIPNVTFVAQRSKITMGASGTSYNAYIGNSNAADSTSLLQSLHPLLFASFWQQSGENQCKAAVIETGGSQSTWSGFIYAPYGRVMLNGSQEYLAGCIIAYTVKLNGSNSTINCDPSAGGSPPTIGIAQ